MLYTKVTGSRSRSQEQKKHVCSRVICLQLKGNFGIIITVTIAVAVLLLLAVHIVYTRKYMERKRTQSARECDK